MNFINTIVAIYFVSGVLTIILLSCVIAGQKQETNFKAALNKKFVEGKND
jgi:hypothetical protein